MGNRNALASNVSARDDDIASGRLPDTSFDERNALSGHGRAPNLAGLSQQDIEAFLRRMIQDGTDRDIYQAMALAREYGVRSPLNRDFQNPPASLGGLLGNTGRPRPLMRMNDSVGFAGGPDDPGRMPESGNFETYPEYEASYLNTYAKHRK